MTPEKALPGGFGQADCGLQVTASRVGGCVYPVEQVVMNKSLQGTSLRSLQRDGYEPNDELSECMRDKKARKVKIKARATIICLRSGSILLVRKKSGKWNFPGGAIEPGESPVAAAARELQEETSIEGHGLLPLCTVQVGLTVHHVFTTHFDDRERAVARNEIVACKWVLRDKLNPAMLSATAAGLLSSQLPALTA